MHRSVAGLLLVALAAFWAPAMPQHVHAPAAHVHVEHQHGPAAHTHEPVPDHGDDQHHDDRRPHLEACTPAAHVVEAVSWASPTYQSAIVQPDAAAPLTITLPAPESRPFSSRADVRAHGPPPSRTHGLLRAPPPILPA